MFGDIVDIKIAADKLTCENKDWSYVESKVNRLKIYTQARDDAQANSIAQLQETLIKANKSNNKVFCQSALDISKVRIDVVIDVWKGR
jgi:hypothetical protein